MDDFELALEKALMNELSDCSTDDAKVAARWARNWLKDNEWTELVRCGQNNKKLQAENARLREALEKAHYLTCDEAQVDKPCFICKALQNEGES